jgi:hypothetical protein
LWFTALYCDADFGIVIWGSGQVKPGQKLPLDRAEITDDTVGLEGMIVLAMPVSVSKEQPNFDILVQEPLGKADPGTRGPGDAPRSPFGQLLAGAAFNTGMRAARKVVESTPAIRTATWTVLPAAKAAAP